jgi:hypothetical protein
VKILSEKKGFIRAFLDFFVLFSGISTASNLERTQGSPLATRGLFLFRSKKDRLIMDSRAKDRQAK